MTRPRGGARPPPRASRSRSSRQKRARPLAARKAWRRHSGAQGANARERHAERGAERGARPRRAGSSEPGRARRPRAASSTPTQSTAPREHGPGRQKNRQGVVVSDKATRRSRSGSTWPTATGATRRSFAPPASCKPTTNQTTPLSATVDRARVPPDVAAQALAAGPGARAGGVRPARFPERDRLRVADNTGAGEILVIWVRGGHRRRYAGVGDMLTATAKQASPQGG